MAKTPMNVIATIPDRPGHRYVFWYDCTEESHRALLFRLHEMVLDPECEGFGWCEAGMVCQRANELRQLHGKSH